MKMSLEKKQKMALDKKHEQQKHGLFDDAKWRCLG